MISSIKDWIILGLLAAVLGLGGTAYWKHQTAASALKDLSSMTTQRDAANGALKAVIEDRDRSRATSEKRVRISDKLRHEAQRKYKELSDALKDNPGWADVPVPDSVWNSLGTASDPQPASGGAAAELPSSAPPAGADQRSPGPLAERI